MTQLITPEIPNLEAFRDAANAAALPLDQKLMGAVALGDTLDSDQVDRVGVRLTSALYYMENDTSNESGSGIAYTTTPLSERDERWLTNQLKAIAIGSNPAMITTGIGQLFEGEQVIWRGEMPDIQRIFTLRQHVGPLALSGATHMNSRVWYLSSQVK